MNKPIYGDITNSSDSSCYPQSSQANPLITQAAALLTELSGANKASTIAQLDNIRHQLMVIAGKGSQFAPYTAGAARTAPKLTLDASGNLTVNRA